MTIGVTVLGAIAILGVLLWQGWQWRQTDRIWRTLQQPLQQRQDAETFDESAIADLPDPARRYFQRAIQSGTPLASNVYLKMRGSFRTRPDGMWLPMRAEQIIAAVRGFVWKARIGRSGFQLIGADRYFNGVGQIQFSLWGLIPLVKGSNTDISRSSLGRLVSESIWLPSALLPQRGVCWEAADETRVTAHLEVDGEPFALTLEIAPDGRLQQVWLKRWGHLPGESEFRYLDFGAYCEGDRTFEGWTIPTQFRGGYGFGSEDYFEFIRATIEEARFG